jgi:hypothetical protein
VTRLHTGRLVLTPIDAGVTPGHPTVLLKRLQEIGLISGQLGSDADKFLAGEKFIWLIDFMGCSPSIQLEPTSSGEPFCHLKVSGPYPKPLFLWGRNTTPPHCEKCRKRIPDWQPIMEAWKATPNNYQAKCPHCAHRQSPQRYNWRQSAGCGRFLLLLENIFPQEAIPSPILMKSLQEASENQPWHYFYVQE